MTFRERVARWLAPDAFRKARTREVARKRLALPPLAEAPPAPSPAPPLTPDVKVPPDVAPEYEAMIALNWGQMPVAATLTRSRVRLLQTAHAPPHEIRRAIAGTEIVIE